MHDSHTLNVLGAGSLAIADLIDGAVTEPAQVSRSGAAALAVLAQAGPLGVTELGQHVGLSQPAAARMVDSLQQAGYVRRSPGHGRAVSVALTDQGQSTAREVLRNRSRRLAGLLDGLSEQEQRTLASLLGTVLTNVYQRVPDANRICRLCDRAECVSTERRCPVGAAAGEAPDA